MDTIKKIIWHVTAEDNVTVDQIRSQHKAQGWSDIGYHLVVYKDGSLHLGRPWNKQGSHCRDNNGNINSLGFSWVTRGNDFKSNDPYGKYLTPEQKRSSEAITAYVLHLAEREEKLNDVSFELNIGDIFGHNDFTFNKACPCFKVQQSEEFQDRITKELESLRAGNEPIESVKKFLEAYSELATASDGVDEENEGAMKGDPEDLINLPADETNDENILYEINDEGLQFIKDAEGLRLESYKDSAGVWTIGYGTTRINGTPVSHGMEITMELAEEYIRKDVKDFEENVAELVNVPLTSNQFSALVSLVYNIGKGGFRGSSVRRKLNEQDFKGAAESFLMWTKAGGRFLQGLYNRRVKEKELFEKECGRSGIRTPDPLLVRQML